MKKLKTEKPYTLPTSIQLISLGLVGGTFALQSIYLTYSVIKQYQQDTGVDGLYSFLITIVLLPIALFLIAYWLNPRKLQLIARSFESLLLGIAGLSVWSLWNYIGPQFIMSNLISDGYSNYALYEVGAASVFLVLYIGGLIWLRKSKRWQ